MILITSADQYVGHCIASHFASHRCLRPRLRLACRDRNLCLGFLNKNIDVRQVDYYHPHELSKAFRGVDHVILAVGNEHDRVAIAENVCKVADRSGVRSIVCVSQVGATATEYPHLRHFASIEDYVVNTANCDWVILRPDWLYQQFHMWSRSIETDRKMALPLVNKDEICPLDVTDLCSAIESLLLMPSKKHIRSMLQDAHVGQVYTLTGPEPVNGQQLVDCLSRGTGYTKFIYQPVRPMDTAYYLQGLIKDIWFDARVKQEHQRMYNDTLDGSDDYSTRVFNAPTDIQIQTWIEYFDWVHATGGSVCVPHMKMLLKHQSGTTIQDFFNKHGNSFKPRV